MLEDVGFEAKFDQLPEFHPGKDTRTPIPQSPHLLLDRMRKKKGDYFESPVGTPHRASGGSRLVLDARVRAWLAFLEGSIFHLLFYIL